MKCLKCGYENPNDVQYCLQCGNPLTSQAVNPLGNNVLSQSVTNTSAQTTNSGNPSQDLEKTMIFPANPTPTNPVVSEPKVETSSTNTNIPDMMNAFEPMNDFPQETQVKVDHSQVNEQVTQSTIPNSVENNTINSSKPVENVVPPVVSPTNPVENSTVAPEKPAEPVFGVEKNRVQSTGPTTLTDHQLQQLTLDFVGKNGAKVLSKNMNWSAFFFSSVYFLYRRMVLYGILYSIFISIVGYVLMNFVQNAFLLQTIVLILTGLIAASLFKNIYNYYVRNKINSIVASHPGESFENLRVYVAQKGGTNLGNVFAQLGISFIVSMTVLSTAVVMGAIGTARSTIDNTPISNSYDSTSYYDY